MSYRYNGNDILAPASTDGSANTLFNYKISGVDAKYLKPFCTSTTTTEHIVRSDIPRFYANALNYKYNSVLDLSFCPKYTLHTSSNTSVAVPSGVTNMFVVCIGGGGGGGGGGVISGGDNNGGSGGGGGGGALKGWFVQSIGSTYDVTIGNGGAFGRPSGNTTVGEGMTSLSGSFGSGNAGGNGSATSFVYNGTTYSSPGGSGGSGGSTGIVNGGTGGTSGGTGGGTPTPFIWKDGNDGYKGFRFNAIDNYSGGIGGGSGNYTGTNSSLHINKKLVNIEKIKNRSTDEITYQNTYEPTSIEYNIAQCEYGNGGRGGRGEAPSNWAWAGYSGNPGCAIVFFYYNNISTTAPLITTVTTTSTHTLNASTTAFKIIVVGGGGGGQAGVQYVGANRGACGGGGASGTSVVAFTKNIPTNKQLSITIGAGGSGGNNWDTTDAYQYPTTDPTNGGSTKVTWNSDSISIEAYGGNKAKNWEGSGSGAFGGVGGISGEDLPFITNNSNTYSLFSSKGIGGSTGSDESAGTNGVGGAGGSTIDLSAHLSEYGPAISSLGTYGYGGNGGKGEASNEDSPDGASPGSPGSSGVVIIIEY
jgi:hypothetical protein